MNERELWKSLIETWIRHREVELELLRRLERSLAEPEEPSAPAPGVQAVSPEPAAPAPAEFVEPSSSAPMEHAEPSSPAETSAEREPAETSPSQEPAETSPSHEPAETYPSHEPTETSAEREPEDPAWVAEVPLLLLGQADTWVGFPWDHVERVALSEEVELPQESEYRFSLGAILQVDREEEPYSLVWTQDGGPATLSCARIGGIVTIDGAVDRSIDSVIHPRSEGSDPRPVLLSLGDFIVALRSRRSARTPAMTVTSAQADESSSSGSEREDEALTRAAETTSGGSDFEDSEAPGRAEETSSGGSVSEDRAASMTEDAAGSASIEASDLIDASDALQDEVDSIYDALPSQPESEGDGGARGGADGLVEHEAEEKILPSRLNGGRRSIPHALVAVHYLPARVAVVRMLRSAGWSVEEEAQPQNLSRRLQGQSPDVLFVEPTGPFSESTQVKLHELVASGSRVVVLGSRLRPGQATPEGVLGRAPRLHFPFTEEESRQLLGYLRVPDSDPRPTA